MCCLCVCVCVCVCGCVCVEEEEREGDRAHVVNVFILLAEFGVFFHMNPSFEVVRLFVCLSVVVVVFGQ